MIEELVAKNEGKTLEFKENLKSLANIIKTVIAFANTAGGIIVVGVEDRTKNIVGMNNILNEEERLISSITDSISPLLVPEISIQSYRSKELLVIQVPHGAGPFYLKHEKPEDGTFIRFGSTNRLADAETLQSLRDYARNIYFDEKPYLGGDTDLLDWEFINSVFKKAKKKITQHNAVSLGLIFQQTNHINKECPTNGGIILFGLNHLELFPDAIIRCGRFLGFDRETILDQIDIETYLPLAIEEALHFIKKNTSMKAEIGRLERRDVPQYPSIAIREAIVNAIIHADYGIKGIQITIAIFDDRIEITNPGALPFGLTLENALLGASRVRNRVIAKVFRALKWIEQWGSGLRRIKKACIRMGLKEPKFEELNNQFRVTLYATKKDEMVLFPWQKDFIAHLKKKGKISTKEAAIFWNVSTRTARFRLISLIETGILLKTGTSEKDPHGGYILADGMLSKGISND